ncbi:homologous-pairing protein 2 homolog [Symsagittifera roscoffensis]|uniref:homologous-pairing protein 2 homolog n=1 Tax=Symsagittifera roscoffensis TaxID=84072 RepID=UPI00307BA782
MTSILVEEGTLKEKVYNKQKVYVYNQALFPEVQKSQIKELDLRINDAKIKLQEIQHKVKQKSAELSKLSSLPTLEKAKEDYEELCRKETELKEKIDKIKESAGAIEPEVRQAILKDHELYSKEARKRKRWCNDLLDMILEGYPSTKDQLMEEIGIEPF